MGKALIIGCGGVASVAIHKCCQNSQVFEEICIASRTKSKCDALKEKLQGTTKTKICLLYTSPPRRPAISRKNLTTRYGERRWEKKLNCTDLII